MDCSLIPAVHSIGRDIPYVVAVVFSRDRASVSENIAVATAWITIAGLCEVNERNACSQKNISTRLSPAVDWLDRHAARVGIRINDLERRDSSRSLRPKVMELGESAQNRPIP